MKDTASAKTNTTMDVEDPPVILRDDAQGGTGTGSEKSIPVAEKQQMTLNELQCMAFGINNLEIIRRDDQTETELLEMVNFIADTAFGHVLDDEALTKGSMVLANAIVDRHIFSLDNMAGIHPKTLTKHLKGFGPGVCHGADLLAKFIDLDKKYGVCSALGFDYDTMDHFVVQNVVNSYNKMQENSLPDNKSFTLANMTGSNVFDVMECFHKFLIEYDLMELESAKVNFELGEHFFQNAWITRKLAQWMYHTSNHHTVQKMSKKNGMAIWRKLCEVFLTGKSKENLTKSLIQKCESLCLYWIQDAHCFFSAFDWHVLAINHLDGRETDKLITGMRTNRMQNFAKSLVTVWEVHLSPTTV